MPISVSSQSYIFLCSIVGGVLMAFIYDIFRIKRKAFKTRSFIIYIEDFLYWMIVAVIMFGVVYYSNEGEIRGYIYIGSIIGVILYVLLLSRIIIKSSLFIIKVIYRLFSTLWTIISYPFKVLLKILSFPGKSILKLLRKAARAAKNRRKSQAAKAAIWKRIFKNIRKKI